jgi:hypothetical protein
MLRAQVFPAIAVGSGVGAACAFILSDAAQTITAWPPDIELAWLARLIVAGLIAALATLVYPGVKAFTESDHPESVRLGALVAFMAAVTIAVITVLNPTLTDGAFLLAWGIIIIASSIPAVINAGRDDPRPERTRLCGRCGYERPHQRTPETERCPECGNYWWQPASYAVDKRQRGDFHGWTIKAKSIRDRFRPRALAFALPVWVLAFIVLFVPIFGHHIHVLSIAPTGLLKAVATSSDDVISGEAFAELLDNRSLPQDERDDLLRWFIDRRAAFEPVDFSAEEALERAIPAGAFSPNLVDRFFEEAYTFNLTAEVTPDGAALLPKLHGVKLATTIELRPLIAVAGVRINDRPFQQPGSSPMLFPFPTTTFAEHDAQWPDLPSTNFPGHTPHFTDVPLPPDLPPGEHTLTVRLHLVSVNGQPGLIVLHQHQLFDPDGDAIPFPGAIWQQTRDVSTTFTID